MLASYACAHAPIEIAEDEKRLAAVTALIEEVRQAYAQNEMDAFLDRYPVQNDADRRKLRAQREPLRNPDLDFSIDKIGFAGESTSVFLHWDLRHAGTTPAQHRRGNAVLRLQGGSAPRLTSIEGDNPFLPSVPPADRPAP